MSEAGKGDSPRPVDAKKYGENYDRIFKRGLKTADDLKNEVGIDTNPIVTLLRLYGQPDK